MSFELIYPGIRSHHNKISSLDGKTRGGKIGSYNACSSWEQVISINSKFSFYIEDECLVLNNGPGWFHHVSFQCYSVGHNLYGYKIIDYKTYT